MNGDKKLIYRQIHSAYNFIFIKSWGESLIHLYIFRLFCKPNTCTLLQSSQRLRFVCRNEMTSLTFSAATSSLFFVYKCRIFIVKAQNTAFNLIRDSVLLQWDWDFPISSSLSRGSFIKTHMDLLSRRTPLSKLISTSRKYRSYWVASLSDSTGTGCVLSSMLMEVIFVVSSNQTGAAISY